MSWTTPKTDWTADDRFNITDFNRIKNNLTYLYDLAGHAFLITFDLVSMGADMTRYSAFWNVAYFNAFETNLDNINKASFNRDYGVKKTFYANGVFIDYLELNRIENATLDLVERLTERIATLPRLPFRLGAYKQMRL